MTEEEFVLDVLRQIGEQGVALARTYLRDNGGSATLQDILSFIAESKGVGRITVPYFWAEYVHDGRGPIQAEPGRYIIFFPNKKDDPRTSGGTDYPLRPELARSLTSDEFTGFLEENKQLRAASLPPKMVVVKSVGPIRKPIPYFTVGLASLPSFASSIVPPQFRALLGSRGYFATEKGTAQGSIG